MKIIKHILELETLLKNDIRHSNKKLKIFAGHLPLRYLEENGNRRVFMDENWWGEFSTFTFRLGCELVRYTEKLGKTGKIMLVVDDDDELLSYENGRYHLNDEGWHKRRRQRLRKKSELPLTYRKILKEFDLDESKLVKQHFDEYSTVLISERNLKDESKEMGFKAPNECSLAYKSLLYNKNQSYIEADNEYHICLIPDQCKTNLCEGIIESTKNVDATYVFFPSIEDMGGIVRVGIGHNKLSNYEVPRVDQYFHKSLVSYLKTTLNNT